MSRAKQVLGKDLMLFVGGKAIALATSCKIGLSSETIDTQSKDSGIWNEKAVKKLAWNCSSDNVFSTDVINGYEALFSLMIAAKPVDIAFGVPVNSSTEYPKNGWNLPVVPYTGKAIITSLELNAPDGDKATFSVALDGTGALIAGRINAIPVDELPEVLSSKIVSIDDTIRLKQSYDVKKGNSIEMLSNKQEISLNAKGIGIGVSGVRFYLNLEEIKNAYSVEISKIQDDSITIITDADEDYHIDCIELVGGTFLIIQ